MKRRAFFLTLAAVSGLAAFVVGTHGALPSFWAAHAQESATQTDAMGTPTSELPFVNKANQPVLQPLTPGAAPIDAEGFQIEPDTHAGDEAHAKKAGLPQFDVTTFPRQLFWLALTFIFLYVVYSRFTLPAIGNVLETRAERIAGDLTRAEALKAEVDRVKADYEAAIAQAQGDAQTQIAAIQAQAKADAEAAEATFKAKADEATASLEKKLDDGRKRIIGELNDMAAGLAVDISNRVAGVKTDASAARSIIDAETGKAKAA